jgi:hypothetical protein
MMDGAATTPKPSAGYAALIAPARVDYRRWVSSRSYGRAGGILARLRLLPVEAAAAATLGHFGLGYATAARSRRVYVIESSNPKIQGLTGRRKSGSWTTWRSWRRSPEKHEGGDPPRPHEFVPLRSISAAFPHLRLVLAEERLRMWLTIRITPPSQDERGWAAHLIMKLQSDLEK